MNHLATASSPYLRQHASNPVDWYPWGPEALERAKAEDKPILLSIGYAACHWCHVMAHESFEDAETARLMNELFVNIKVDREERPDLDGIYMTAVQAMTGHGGWPMTAFLTPDGTPFYGGTYFPPEDRHGMPAFRRVLRSIATAYRERRGDVDRTAEQMRELYRHGDAVARRTGTPSPKMLDDAYRALARTYDERHGGFGGAPKFPQVMVLDFLLRHGTRTQTPAAVAMAADSFRRMASGGIHDQVGGGFHRYAVDDRWLVPHFEKMLYDNALLARLGTHLVQATGDPEIRRVTEGIVGWVAREMTSPDGAFYASLDADSDGEEGRFYLWSAAEMDEVLGADAATARSFWGATPEGNFEGRNILHVPAPPQVAAQRAGVTEPELHDVIARSRDALHAAREHRVRPARDDKVVASWNALMLRALAEGARAFGRDDWRSLAVRNGEFIARSLVRGDRVLRRPATPTAPPPGGYLEDHAGVALASLSLYELTFDRAWLEQARTLGASMLHWFWDDTTAAFHDTASDAEALVTRPREVTDNATPSGTSLAVELLLRLAVLYDDRALRRRADWVLESLAEPMARVPAAFGHMLGNADFAVNGPLEVALSGDPSASDFRALARVVDEAYVPALVLAGGEPSTHDGIALLADRPMRGGRATAYVCRNYVCDEPVVDAEKLGRAVVSGQSSVVSRLELLTTDD